MSGAWPILGLSVHSPDIEVAAGPAAAQALRMGVPALLDFLERIGRLVTDGDQELLAGKDGHFMKEDALVGSKRCSLDDQEPVLSVGLDLRPLMRLDRIFDGQRVEAEFFLQDRHVRWTGIDNIEPDERPGLVQDLADLVHVARAARSLPFTKDLTGKLRRALVLRNGNESRRGRGGRVGHGEPWGGGVEL